MNVNTKWNVIEEDEFKTVLREVFEKVAGSLRKTLGPYGTTSMLEQYGDYHVTKDGFQVLKAIHFEDPMLNNIMSLLTRISLQVVYQVGDGSTSAIVAANEIIKQFDKHPELKEKYRPKDLLEKFTQCADKVVERLYENATMVEDYEDIRKIALISTNGNKEISDIIANIYKETENPNIDFVTSKTNETSYDIIDGYTANITYLDTIYATNDDGICRITDGVYVLLFDHKIDIENSLTLISAAAQKAAPEGKRVVVVAPAYDKMLLDHIRKTITMEFKSRGTSTIVYCRASLISNMTHILYNDFAILCGANIIHEQYGEEKIDPSTIDEYLGHVNVMEIGQNTTLIQGFTNRSEELYEKAKLDAKLKYNEIAEKYEKIGVGDTNLLEARNRMTKLACSMGVIRVGGSTTLEKKALYDLVDDAVKACESAYRYGYNIGGGLSVIYAIKSMLNDETIKLDGEDRNFYQIIIDAFRGVFGCVIANKYPNSDNASNILTCLEDEYEQTEKGHGYDLITDEMSDDIINSCRTDIEILRGAISVVSLLETSNQYISVITHD